MLAATVDQDVETVKINKYPISARSLPPTHSQTYNLITRRRKKNKNENKLYDRTYNKIIENLQKQKLK